MKAATPAGAGRRKAAKKAGGEQPTASAGNAMPLAPEAMPRVRRTADRPAPAAKRQTRPPRDRSKVPGAGLRDLGWREMAEAARKLARELARNWTPDLVVGLAKGGVFVGQEIATTLGVPFFPVRVGKRSRDVGIRAPDAAASMPAEASGKRVLVVDDIAGSGASLQTAADDARAVGAAEVRTASLIVRDGGFLPDHFGVETADLVVFPWDYEASPGAVGSASPEDEEEQSPAVSEEELERFGV